MSNQSIKKIDMFQVILTKKKEYSSSDDSENDSDKEEENTSNSEIKEEVYEEDDRNDEDSSNEFENQIDVEINDHNEKDYPMSSHQAVRMVSVSVSIMLCELHFLAITSAFLQGDDIEWEVFVQLPSEIMEGQIWKLKRCIYGLNNATRHW